MQLFQDIFPDAVKIGMVSEKEITDKLKTINYEYNTEKNQFI